MDNAINNKYIHQIAFGLNSFKKIKLMSWHGTTEIMVDPVALPIHLFQCMIVNQFSNLLSKNWALKAK